MFFCNPFHDNGDDDNKEGQAKFPFLMDNHHHYDKKLSWLSLFGGAGDTTPGLKSTTSSCSTDSSYDGKDDDFMDASSSSRLVFHDALLSLDDDTISRSRRRRHLSRLETMAFWGSFLLLLMASLSMILGYYSYNSNTINNASLLLLLSLESFQDAKIWVQSAAVRIWDGTMIRTNLFLGLLNKIDTAILSLFRWDKVDDAVVDWTKRTIVFLGNGIFVSASGVVQALFFSSSSSSTQQLKENVARSILRTISDAPGAQQALAVLDFIQDGEP